MDLPAITGAARSRATAASTPLRTPRAAGAREAHSLVIVIFACVHNAGRSQMAAAFFNRLVHPTRARALSAGTRPASTVHPEVVDAMRDVGIDLSGARPQRLTPDLAQGAHFLVTMGCGEECPFVPGAKVEDWPIPDPKGQPPARVREIRDEIERRVRDLVSRLEGEGA